MTEGTDDLLTALGLAYSLMLRMPHDGLRARNQEIFCRVRDAIAADTGESPQEVQDAFEAVALKLRLAE